MGTRNSSSKKPNLTQVQPVLWSSLPGTSASYGVLFSTTKEKGKQSCAQHRWGYHWNEWNPSQPVFENATLQVPTAQKLAEALVLLEQPLLRELEGNGKPGVGSFLPGKGSGSFTKPEQAYHGPSHSMTNNRPDSCLSARAENITQPLGTSSSESL